MHLLNSEMRGIAGLIRCWSIRVLVHWDTGAHRRCHRKLECGELVEFDLSADCVHECNCTRSPIFLSLKWPCCYVVTT